MARPAVGRFSFEFRGALPAVWAAMADTARSNAAAGLPRHSITEVPDQEGGQTFKASGRIGALRLEWDDLPCNWVRERWFEHRRRFTRGPFSSFDARLDLTPTSEGCRGDYRLTVTPKGLLGRIVLAGGFMGSAMRSLQDLAGQADRFARGAAQAPFQLRNPAVTGPQRARLDRLAEELNQGPYGHGLGPRLAQEVAEALDVDAERLRPLLLARRWGVPDRHAIEACLQAVRLGMLELRWDLLCPRCRGAKLTTATLDRIPTGAHCPTCNIDYGRDFSRNVELTFRAAPAIRPLGEGEFCLLGPMSTPHIWVHVTLEPGERRRVELDLAPGPYRLRTLEAGRQADIEHAGGAFPTVEVRGDMVSAAEPSPPGTIELRNVAPYRRTLVVEDRRWVADALTADRATTFQAFRDLCSAEVLRPGDEVAVGRVALLFSDLKGSTTLYETVGDAAAYHLVRAHFAYLAAIVREHDGAIVKTIGDAVMAAFHDPAQALRAAIAMQERVADFNSRSTAPIVLKLGLHEGPCIAVTLNDRLDYFGQTVNLAARLQGQSRGGDIVLSQTLAPLAEESGLRSGHRISRETAVLRGLSEPVGFVRLAPETAV